MHFAYLLRFWELIKTQNVKLCLLPECLKIEFCLCTCFSCADIDNWAAGSFWYIFLFQFSWALTVSPFVCTWKSSLCSYCSVKLLLQGRHYQLWKDWGSEREVMVRYPLGEGGSEKKAVVLPWLLAGTWNNEAKGLQPCVGKCTVFSS